jgi:hypothetical protein
MHAALLGGMVGLTWQKDPGSFVPFSAFDTGAAEPGLAATMVVDDVPPPKKLAGLPAMDLYPSTGTSDCGIAQASFLQSAPRPGGPQRAKTPEITDGNGRGISGGAGSQHKPATFFQIPLMGKSLVYVIDRSGSMGVDNALDVARRELLASLQQLPPGTLFQIIAYNRVAQTMHLRGSYGLIPVSPDAIAEASARLRELKPLGGTNHVQALKSALMLRPETILFLTDGDDFRWDEIEEICRLNAGNSIIHAIALTESETQPQALARLGQENHGICKMVRLSP